MSSLRCDKCVYEGGWVSAGEARWQKRSFGRVIESGVTCGRSDLSVVVSL